jgi:hypothetical protein
VILMVNLFGFLNLRWILTYINRMDSMKRGGF